jgi:HTH-type transcriptional regulator, quorum sensing regulator NprR
MKFLTTGEKIKETRRYLKMTQEDLQDESISRALISMIEINIRSLTKDAAINLVEKFKKRANELGINLDIDEKDEVKALNRS